MIVDQLFTTYTVVGNNRQFFSESRPGRETAKKAKQRKLAESMLMEDPVFRQARQFGQLLVEYNLTKAQVQQLFKDVEQGATAAGGNRTGLGKAKDATTQAIGSVQKMLASARKWVKDRPTYQAVDAEYNKAMAALGKAGGENGEANAITKAIYKYRDAAKNYPRAAGLAKWAIITAAGFATGGLGGVGVAAGLAAIDSALKDKEIVDIVGDAATAALVSGGIQGAGDLASAASDAYNGVPSAADIAANNAALGDWNDTAIPGGPASNINGLDLPNAAGDPDFYNNPSNTPPVPGEYSDAANNAYQQNPDPSDAPVDPNTRADYTQPDVGGGTYTIMKGDQLGYIAQAQGTTPELIRAANPDIDFSKALQQGQEINLPAAGTPGQGSLWADYKGGMYGDKVPGAGGQTAGMSPAEIDQMRNQNLFRMQDQADAAYYADKPDDVGINPRNNDAVGTGMPGSANTTPGPQGDPSFYKIDYSKPGPVTTDSMGQKLEYGIPVNDQGSFKAPNPGLQAEELAGQKAAYNNWLADFKSRFPEATQQPDGSWNAGKQGLAPVYPSNVNPNADLSNSPFRPKNESINYKIIPADQLIDQKLTMMAWALNESVNRKGQQSVHLTTKGVRTVFENIGRYRRAYLKEYIGAPTADYGHPTAPGAPASATAGQGKPQGWFGRGLDAIGRGVDKVGNYVSNVGHNVITKVTADKLNNMWNRAGEPYDSDRLYQLLTTEWGVPKEVVGSVYGKMGIPYTAPATVPNGTPAPQRGAGIQTGEINAIDPDTGKPYEKEKLARMYGSGATTAQTSAAGGAQQPALTGGPTAGLPPTTAGQPKVTYGKGFEKFMQPKPTTQFPNFGTAGMAPAYKTATAPAAKTTVPTTATFKAPGAPSVPTAPKAPADQELTSVAETIKQVKKMLETVQTRDDVAFIKKYINRQFSGQLSESADARRSHLLNEVTRIGALRRRTHSQQLAR